MSKNLLLWVLLLASTMTYAQSSITLDSTTLQVSVLATNQDVPWEILWGPDDWIWLTERGGTISRMNPDTGEKVTLLTIADCYEQQESGLLGMVLHPDFENHPYVYVVYNYLQGFQIKERLVRYTYNGTNLNDQFVLLNSISGNMTHIGSRLIILPDTTLLMTTGDAQDQPSAQDLTELTGKILRFNLDGTIPADNPFGSNNPVYSYGHRNAQGLVLASNGILYSSEHGPTNDDELNIIVKGGNYGWPTVQGFCDTPLEMAFCNVNPVTEPLLAWTPTLAVAGVDYFDHPAIPEWQNSLLMVALKAKRLHQFKLAADGTIDENNIFLENTFGRLRDLCVAPDGRVFLSTSNRDAYGSPGANDDKIIVLQNLDFLPQAAFTYTIGSCATVQFNNASENATHLLWNFGDGYTSTANNPIYTYANAGEYTVTLIAYNGSIGADTLSLAVSIACNVGLHSIDDSHFVLIPNPVVETMQLQYPMHWAGSRFGLYTIAGKMVDNAILDDSGSFVWSRKQLPAGVYYVQIATPQGALAHQKIVLQ